MPARISKAEFRRQVDRARQQWPFIGQIEKKHGMPEGYLYAVGSRETNLKNVIGDNGNGFGVWQRDKRWWPIDRSYLKNVRKQAEDAAKLLSANHRVLGNWKDAASAYNAGLTGVQRAISAGRTADSATTGGDYGADVMGRLSLYSRSAPAVPASNQKATNMPYLTNLAQIARRTGFPVVEQPGWRGRGHGPMGPVRSIIAHHDAARHSPTTFNTVVQNGRAGLPGPLSQFTLRRDGTIHVVASGMSYHAGSTVNDGLYSNAYSIGIEAGNDGVGEPWPQRQLNAYVALCGELAKEFNLPASRIRGHKEIAPSRKIDPAGINMADFRSKVARYMKSGPSGGGAAAPKSIAHLYSEEFPMRMPEGGKLKRGGATQLRWEAVTVPSVLREHDLVIGSMKGVHIHTINTWKYITKDNAEQRWGVSSKRPGGVGSLMRNGWVHGNAGCSLVIPKGVAVLHIAYATDSDWSLSISPRKV